jgi:peptidoglycan/xylan/chitin deacetylase (PgdA/CDA1 family)
VRAVDGAGNWGPVSTRPVKIDTTAPTITLITPTKGAAYVQGGGATCAWTTSDATSGVAGQGASVDGVPESHGDLLDALALGAHSFAVAATDRAGNRTSRLVPFTIVPPAIAVTSPNGEENWLRGTHHEIAWRLDDPVVRGSFDILLRTATTGWSKLNDAPIAADGGRTEYSYAWAVDRPATTGYLLRVEYRIGGGDVLARDDSDAEFSIAPAPLDPWAGKLVAVGRYAYVAGGASGLQIYDIRDPGAPVLTGVCDTPGAAADVFVIGNCAYVADGVSGLAVIDVSDPQRPALVRELALPGPAARLAVSRGRLLEQFEAPAGWTVSGATLVADSVHVKEGQAALKAIIPPASTGRVMKSDLDWDLSRDSNGIELWVYLRNVGLPPLTQSRSAWLRLYLSNANNFTNTFYASSNATVHEGWNLLRFSPGDWKTFGSPTWSAPIRRVAVDVVTAADSGLEVTLDGLRAGVRGLRPAFLWTFDDGYDEVYQEVLPYLSAKGQDATMYVRSDYPDTGGFKITTEHLQSLYDAGWALANHTVDHTQLQTVDQATAAAKIKAGYDWLVARGFTRAANHLAYPFNATSPEAMAAARDSGVATARGGNNRNVQMPVDEPLLLPSFGFDDTSSPTVALWQTRIDRAIASGSTIICCAHRFDATTLPVFQGIVDLLAERHVWTPTIDEWWHTLAAQSETGETLAGRYLYVACGDAGVQVVDITDPLSPTLSGLCATGGSANDLAVDEGYVYAADGAGDLPVIDATLPTDPTLVGSAAVGGSALGIAVSGGYAYLAEGAAGLRIVSIADPSHPVTTATLDTPGVAADVVVAGDTAYVAAGAAGVQIVDISDPAEPVLVGSRALPGTASGLVAFGGRVYVAAGSAGLRTASVVLP